MGIEEMSAELDPALAVELAALRQQDAMNAIINQYASPIQQFYCGSTVLITGGNGFMGKQLVEKLFRSCKIKRVFLLMRPRKTKNIQEKLEYMLKDPVFDKLHVQQPNFVKKLVPVQGDVAELELGLDKSDRKSITEQVDIIFHLAATIRFDEPIRKAVLTNARGTRELIKLAKGCSKLRSLIHVSTAYAHATVSKIDKEVAEKFYPCPLPPDVIIPLVETIDEKLLNEMSPILTKDWPNTYTYTKAIAEEIVRTESGNLPACIVKPPIVVGSFCEPMPGWLDTSCVFSANGVLVGAVIGGWHVSYLRNPGLNCLNFAPVDIVNNAIIAAGWDSAQTPRHEKRDVVIYNVVNRQEACVSMGYIQQLLENECRNLASSKAIWYCFCIHTSSKLMYWILKWPLHYIPAYIMDGLCIIMRKKPQGIKSLVNIYEKVENMFASFEHFLSNKFLFTCDNMEDLIGRMSEADKHIYNCNLKSVEFRKYLKIWIIGVRKYIYKESLTKTAEGEKKQRIFKVMNYVVLFIYMWVLWSIITIFWKIIQYAFQL